MKLGKCMVLAGGLLALCASPVFANEPGTWTLYAGAGSIQPDGKLMSFDDPIEAGTTVGLKVNNATSMTFGFNYMATPNWAVDLLAALPFTHDLKATVTAAGEFSETARIGSIDHIPPTLSLQYHFTTDGNFDPYIGLGLNYTMFFDEKLIPELVAEGVEKVRLEDSFGIAAQVGGDWSINENWIFNVDIRYIDIGADASLYVTGFDEKIEVGTVEVDPWVYAVNLGYRFH
jgi:outer membrane protein